MSESTAVPDSLSSARKPLVVLPRSSLVGSVLSRPLRALVLLTLLGALLLAAGNLWAWHHYRQAEQLVEKQQFATAYEHYADCLRVWRWSASTHFLAGRTARRAGMYVEAEQHFAACQRLQGGESDNSFPLALERLLLRAQSGDLIDIEEILWAHAKKETADTPLILEAMARGYMRMLRLGIAMNCLQQLVERNPDNVEARVNRGWVWERINNAGEAIKDYQYALKLNPDRDDARLSLAKLLVKEVPEDARAHFERLISSQPDNPEVMLGLAEAYRSLGETDKARPLIEAVLAKDPENPKGLAEQGVLALAAGKSAEGEALLRKAIAIDPANLDAQFQLYLCLVQQPGRKEEAAAQLETHKRVGEDLKRLAQIASKEMSRHPADPDLHYELGVLYLRYGKPDVGIRWLESALRLSNGAHQRSHRALYEYYKAAGEPRKAEQHRALFGSDTDPSSQPRP